MATSSIPAAVFGATGATGSHILSNLLSLPSYNPVTTISRRAPTAESPNLNAVVESDSSKWSAGLAALHPRPSTVFAALGTTRAAAGGIDQQWKIDHDLNIDIAKGAKAAGVSTYVCISSAGVRSPLVSSSPYAKMKIGVEDAIKELDFDHAIIVSPGGILTERQNAGFAEKLFINGIRKLGKLSPALQDKLGQEVDVIAKASIHAAELAREGKAPSKYWVLGQSDIVRLGRTEYKATKAATLVAEPTTTAAGPKPAEGAPAQ